jgi:hypothetical protein
MLDEVLSSDNLYLPIPAEGAYVWNLEVIVVVVRIDHMSCKYEPNLVVDFVADKKMT